MLLYTVLTYKHPGVLRHMSSMVHTACVPPQGDVHERAVHGVRCVCFCQLDTPAYTVVFVIVCTAGVVHSMYALGYSPVRLAVTWSFSEPPQPLT